MTDWRAVPASITIHAALVQPQVWCRRSQVKQVMLAMTMTGDKRLVCVDGEDLWLHDIDRMLTHYVDFVGPLPPHKQRSKERMAATVFRSPLLRIADENVAGTNVIFCGADGYERIKQGVDPDPTELATMIVAHPVTWVMLAAAIAPVPRPHGYTRYLQPEDFER